MTTKPKAFLSLLCGFAMACTAFATPIQWRVNTLETASKSFTAYHGETLAFEPIFVHQGNVITNLDLSIYWQTNGMDTVWWSAPGTSFTPAMDTGASDYRFFIRATASRPASGDAVAGEEVIYRANGRIKLLPSPGFTPSELELPAKSLDFATIDIRNAPWATPADVAAAVAAVDVEETDPTVDAKIAPLATKAALAQLQAEVDGKQPAGNYLTSYTETDPTVAATIAPITTSLATLNDKVNAWEGFWSGDDFHVAITNVLEEVGATRSPGGHLPQLSLFYKNENGELICGWRENLWQDWLLGEYLPTNNYTKAQVDAAIAELDANKADRAWGFYDSTTGNYAPEGYTQISSGAVMLSAGYGFQRTLTTTGAAYWVLTGNYTTGANTAAENGLFALYDCEGNAVIEAYKGDKQLVGADAEAVTTDGTTLVVNYAVESEEHPTLYLCYDLATHEWKAESEPDCVATVVWSGASGAWTVRATPKVATGKLFAYAMFYQGGESYIDIPYTVRRMKIGETLYTLGTATISGNTVLTLTPVSE